MAVILICVFMARAWSLSSKAKESPDLSGNQAVESFDLKVHYHHRPPYYVKTTTGVEGLCATPVAEALKSAGINFHWAETPPKRQLHLLQQNPPQDCIIGWFKTREREQFARFSTTIYQDQPAIALVRRADRRIPERCTVAELLGLPDIIMLSRTGYSYGALVDRALARINPLRVETGVASSEWPYLLYMQRADFLLIAPQEADFLLSRTQLPRNRFRYVVLTDMPAGERRYVLFSRAVPPAIVDRFNSAFRTREIQAKLQAATGDRP
jgi:hypothetical protein